MRVPGAPHPLQHLAVSVLGFGHFSRCVDVSHCFNLQMPNDMMLNIVSYAFLPSVYLFFGEVSVQIFCPFLILLIVFLLSILKSSSYILATVPLSDRSSAMFSPTLLNALFFNGWSVSSLQKSGFTPSPDVQGVV